MIEINWKPSNVELRVFCLLQLVFFGIIAYSLHNKSVAPAICLAIASVSTLVCIAGLIRPQATRVLYVGWMVAAYPIGWTVSHVILALVFYFVVTPIGLVMRLCGRDPMRRTFDREAKSYWIKRPERTDTKRYFRQF